MSIWTDAAERTPDVLNWFAREVNRWTADPAVYQKFEVWVRRAVERHIRRREECAERALY